MKKHKIDKAFGKRLRALRNTKGLTQTDVAEHCGITFQQVQKYETGTNRVSISRMYELADALGMDPADLVRGLEIL